MGRHQTVAAGGRRTVPVRPRVTAGGRHGRHCAVPREADAAEPVRPACLWAVAEGAGVGSVAAVVGLLVARADVLVDWREPLLGAALLWTPLLVRHVLLGVLRRWIALAVAYAVLVVVAVLAARLGPWSSSAGGFLGAACGTPLGALGFVLTGRVPWPPRVRIPGRDGRR